MKKKQLDHVHKWIIDNTNVSLGELLHNLDNLKQTDTLACKLGFLERQTWFMMRLWCDAAKEPDTLDMLGQQISFLASTVQQLLEDFAPHYAKPAKAVREDLTLAAGAPVTGPMWLLKRNSSKRGC